MIQPQFNIFELSKNKFSLINKIKTNVISKNDGSKFFDKIGISLFYNSLIFLGYL